MIWIGVDAHKRLHQALALGTQGEIRGEQTIGNESGPGRRSSSGPARSTASGPWPLSFACPPGEPLP